MAGVGGDMVEREGLSCPGRRGKGRKGWKCETPNSAHLISFTGKERRATGARRQTDKSSPVDCPRAQLWDSKWLANIDWYDFFFSLNKFTEYLLSSRYCQLLEINWLVRLLFGKNKLTSAQWNFKLTYPFKKKKKKTKENYRGITAVSRVQISQLGSAPSKAQCILFHGDNPVQNNACTGLQRLKIKPWFYLLFCEWLGFFFKLFQCL